MSEFKRIGIYPGTFDPITKGHLHIIKRASRLVDKLIIGVAGNERKKPIFSHEERLSMVRQDIENLPDKACEIEVQGFDGLLVHYAREQGASCVFRGLRAVSDFDRLPILAFTSTINQGFIEKGEEIGIEKFILKTDRDLLVKEITEQLSARKADEEAA